jgi:thiazole synthase
MLKFYDREFSSRLLVGSALYPSPAIMQGAIRASGAQIVTVSLRRESAGGKTGDAFWSLIRELYVTVLPNTAGCRSVREAVTTAKLARELFGDLLDQARGDRRQRHLAARRGRPGRGRRHPDQGRL